MRVSKNFRWTIIVPENFFQAWPQWNYVDVLRLFGLGQTKIFFLLLKHEENLMAMGGGCWKDNAARWLWYTWLSQLLGFRKVCWQPSTLQLKLIRTPKWSEVKHPASLFISQTEMSQNPTQMIKLESNWNQHQLTYSILKLKNRCVLSDGSLDLPVNDWEATKFTRSWIVVLGIRYWYCHSISVQWN